MLVRPKIAILTLHPYNYGGVLSSLRVVFDYCKQFADPTVFFLGFDRDISASVRGMSSVSRTRSTTYFNMPCVEIGARWAWWEPGHYEYTYTAWRDALNGYDYFFVTSGNAIAAHPLILLKKPFVLWLATPYDDDRAARRAQMSLISQCIDMFSTPLMHNIERQILRRANVILALSSYTRDRVQQILGSERHNLEICGYPITHRHMLETHYDTQHPIILAVGRFDDPRKNIALLLRTFDRIHAHITDAQLYIVGSTPPDTVLAPFKKLPSFEHIMFTGFLHQQDLETIYRRARLMLITSYQEGLGIVGLEALAHSTPVISTNCGGPIDYIEHGKTGFLVDIDDDAAMAEKAIQVLTDDVLHRSLVHAGIQMVENVFSCQAIHSKFSRALQTVFPSLASYMRDAGTE